MISTFDRFLVVVKFFYIGTRRLHLWGAAPYPARSPDSLTSVHGQTMRNFRMVWPHRSLIKNIKAPPAAKPRAGVSGPPRPAPRAAPEVPVATPVQGMDPLAGIPKGAQPLGIGILALEFMVTISSLGKSL
jgi:hypothetical protein